MDFPRSEISVSSFPLKESYLPRNQRKQIDSVSEPVYNRTEPENFNDAKYIIYPDDVPKRTTTEFVYDTEGREVYITMISSGLDFMFIILKSVIPEDFLHMLEALRYKNSLTSIDKIYCEHILPLFNKNKSTSESTKLMFSMFFSYLIKKCISIMNAKELFEKHVRVKLEKILNAMVRYINGESVDLISIFRDDTPQAEKPNVKVSSAPIAKISQSLNDGLDFE